MKNMNNPATPKQIETLYGLAVPIPEGLTKLEASHLIREHKTGKRI